MDKIPYDQFVDMLAAARTKVEPGTQWHHYKGGEYTVKDIVLLEETMSLAVVYTPAAHPTVAFVRPLTSWLEEVEFNGRVQPRFVQAVSSEPALRD